MAGQSPNRSRRQQHFRPQNALRSIPALHGSAPQDGDYWRGCNDARAAGTAPIYRGEPGYREGMDGDNDGIACEPYR
ncbi:excalibur calcium-binding domain-containing protein [Sphingopyxis sp.]|uniref:excalibur calcium-binding domain-containing protein n=1 Tax=Sphingopyxis sp. TaxID=1908224 RepID=UPI0025E19E8A|nr:excalibur calcium-binding domain-containing protein [Sphingopyxis sp.]